MEKQALQEVILLYEQMLRYWSDHPAVKREDAQKGLKILREELERPQFEIIGFGHYPPQCPSGPVVWKRHPEVGELIYSRGKTNG